LACLVLIRALLTFKQRVAFEKICIDGSHM
jgi:hypothetical protein